MFKTLQAKIWLTVFTIVLLFTFFTLYYFPMQQRQVLFTNYHEEVQNRVNTVALGVRIALNEQNYEGVQTAMEFVKGDPNLRFVSLLQYDTVWNDQHTSHSIKETVFKTFPEGALPTTTVVSDDSLIVKKAPFQTPLMSGAILLGQSTAVITESQRRIFRTSILISAVILLIGLLIGLWLARNLSGPVIALRNAAQRITSGDLTPVVTNFSKDEIGDLAKAFNLMVQELAFSREKVNASNRSLTESNNTLYKTLDDLKATQAQLIQSEKMVSLGELTAGIAHEIQNPLNFVNNFAEVSNELVQEMVEELQQGNREEAIAVAKDVAQNLEKISFHGKRADGIVKGMLQHSRKSTGQKEEADINVLCDEYVRLSYHGLRAKDKSFNADFRTDLDERLDKIKVVPQDLGRVLLNLINNAFYAVSQKKDGGADYKPTVTVSTKRLPHALEITVKDNGQGIPEKIRDKIFQPFFTTKPTGQGTGLGLSLSYDIITKGHGGKLSLQSEEGKGTCFIINLPV